MLRKIMDNIELPVKYTGRLRLVNTIIDGTNLQSPAVTCIHPNNKFVYVALTGADGIAWLTVDRWTKTLTYGGKIVSSALYDNCTDLCLSPDGLFLYAASKGTNSISWFSINQVTGVPTYIDQYSSATNIPQCCSVCVSPDGLNIYTGSTSTSTDEMHIACFTRNTTTGAPTFVEHYHNGSVYKGGQTVRCSPNGNFVLLACSGIDSLNVFARNAADSGKLTYSSQYKDTTNSDGLRDFCFSPDWDFIYCSCYSCDTVTILSFNTTTGDLALVANVKDTTNLKYVYNAWATKDYVYTIGRQDSNICVWRRDKTAGTMTLKERIAYAPAAETRHISLSPNGEFAVMTSITDHGVSCYQRLVQAA